MKKIVNNPLTNDVLEIFNKTVIKENHPRADFVFAKRTNPSLNTIVYLPNDKLVKNNNYQVFAFDGQRLIYSKKIFEEQCNNGLEYMPENKYFKDSYLKVLALMNTFYKKVEIIHIVDGRFSRYIGKHPFTKLNQTYMPTFEIQEEVIKITGSYPYKEELVIPFISVNYNSPDRNSYIEDLFTDISGYIQDYSNGIKLSSHQSLDELRSNLDLIQMLLI